MKITQKSITLCTHISPRAHLSLAQSGFFNLTNTEAVWAPWVLAAWAPWENRKEERAHGEDVDGGDATAPYAQEQRGLAVRGEGRKRGEGLLLPFIEQSSGHVRLHQ